MVVVGLGVGFLGGDDDWSLLLFCGCCLRRLCLLDFPDDEGEGEGEE